MTRPKPVKDWECLECGKRLTLAQAQRAVEGTTGCPKCGGVDIDLRVGSVVEVRLQ